MTKTRFSPEGQQCPYFACRPKRRGTAGPRMNLRHFRISRRPSRKRRCRMCAERKNDETPGNVAKSKCGSKCAGTAKMADSREECQGGLHFSAFRHLGRNLAGLWQCAGSRGERIWTGVCRAARLVEEKHRQSGRERDRGGESAAREIRFEGDRYRQPVFQSGLARSTKIEVQPDGRGLRLQLQVRTTGRSAGA